MFISLPLLIVLLLFSAFGVFAALYTAVFLYTLPKLNDDQIP